MFKELVPILRNRAVLMTATALDDDQIRVNVVPKKMKDGDHDALTTPLSVTGTAEELDTQLAATLVGFVASHLQMKNALEKAKADMDVATKAAQAEARAKAKAPASKAPVKAESAPAAVAAQSSNPIACRCDCLPSREGRCRAGTNCRLMLLADHNSNEEKNHVNNCSDKFAF